MLMCPKGVNCVIFGVNVCQWGIRHDIRLYTAQCEQINWHCIYNAFKYNMF